LSRTAAPEPRLLARVLELAERGRFTVSPNPMVGALVARKGRVVAEGFHERAGGPHAEVLALERAGAAARGADLYVSLEPCVHFGRTPPCAPRVVASGVGRVVVLARDPNPQVHGRGITALERAGIPVVRADAAYRLLAERQNEKFAVWARRGRPFVLAKWAATMDGKTASATGESRWITGPASRRRAMALREEYDAVLVGAATVLADDPRLTRRLGWNRVTGHRRIVLDGRLRTPVSARVFRDPEGGLIVTALPPRHPRVRAHERRGVEVWSLPGGRRGRVPLGPLLARLGRAGVASLMVEGGAETLGEFFRAGLVDRVAVFTAPKILGGGAAPGGVGGPGLALSGARRLIGVEHERLGEDWLVTGRVAPSRRPTH
jgi:diaminohydroxyphosphoribosylaminopyrimidine deaminase/5-amino-6-(5-phosphoribosylamino)uracil reductase